MNNLKKLISLLLICAFMCSMLTAYAQEATTEFSDADSGKLYASYITQMAEKGIIKGVSNNTLAPDDICTRGQFVTFLWRASQMPEPRTKTAINDLHEDSYYTDAAMWAHENSVCKIYSDGSFKADTPVDREHAAYFLYNWAKYLGKCEANTGVLLTLYADGKDISKDSVTAFAWALSKELIFADENSMLNPKMPITRGEVIYSIGRLLEEHICLWDKWTDNGDGTCKRVCLEDSSHAEAGEHLWNDGELTSADSKTLKGEITYTCTNCLATKKEVVNDITTITTRSQLEEAIVNTALAYYLKNPYMQYDSTHLTDMSAYYGGLIRLNAQSAPEYATSDSNFYSVCSDYVYQCYLEGLNIQAMGEANFPFGLSTSYLFRLGDNQPHTETVSTKVNEPITDKDIDACILRWINYDKYKTSYDSRINTYIPNGVFESTAFTDYTEGLTFKDDGYEGSFHYSYYDEGGNVLEPDAVREKHIYPLLETSEKFMRPGDIIVNQNHSLIYMGGKRILDCSGQKIKTDTGEDKIEQDGSIYCNTIIPGPFNWKSSTSLIVLRPLEFVLKEGFDNNPGNDIAKDFVIPKETKSRIKYPAMTIDRTVDISPYGTAVKDDFVTYTVKITNCTNNEFYKEWLSAIKPNEKAEKSYKNIVVKETLPENCELDKASLDNGGTFKDGVITWNIKTLKSGESVTLIYNVKVKGEIGTFIENGKGMVDNIPSNVLINKIGSGKLNTDLFKVITSDASAGSDALIKYGSDTDFANNIYSDLGKELNLPETKDIVKELFTAKAHIPGSGGMLWGSSSTPINLFEIQNEVNDEYKSIKQMLVHNFNGGRRFFVGEDKKWDFNDNSIKEFRESYLEPGDIIVFAKAKDKNNLNYNFETVGVLVYDGEKLLSSVKTGDSVSYEIYSNDKLVETLTKLFMTDKDIFFALRPSQFSK